MKKLRDLAAEFRVAGDELAAVRLETVLGEIGEAQAFSAKVRDAGNRFRQARDNRRAGDVCWSSRVYDLLWNKDACSSFYDDAEILASALVDGLADRLVELEARDKIHLDLFASIQTFLAADSGDLTLNMIREAIASHPWLLEEYRRFVSQADDFAEFCSTRFELSKVIVDLNRRFYEFASAWVAGLTAIEKADPGFMSLPADTQASADRFMKFVGEQADAAVVKEAGG